MKTMIAVLFIAAFSLMGCNTMRGLGQDVEKVGEKIQKKAE